MEDELEELIDAPHDLYGDHSIYEVMDLDRPDAIERMVEMYNPPDGERIERYFAVLDWIRAMERTSAAVASEYCAMVVILPVAVFLVAVMKTVLSAKGSAGLLLTSFDLDDLAEESS